MNFTVTIIALAGSVMLWSCQVNPRFSKLPVKEQISLTPAAIPAMAGKQEAAGSAASAAGSTSVFKIDGAAIQQLVAEKELTHVYIYGTFCKPCVAELPAIMKMHEARPTVGLVMVTPESWTELNRVKSFLAARQIEFPTYMLDLEKYGDEYNGVKRYRRLLQELAPGYAGPIGFPTHLLLNRERKVLYVTAGAGHFSAGVVDSVLRANHQ